MLPVTQGHDDPASCSSYTSSEGPDVLAGEPRVTLTDDRPTHLVILLTTSGVSEPLTGISCQPSPTHSGDLLPHRGALLGGVRNVEVGYTSPARSTTVKERWL